MTTHYQVATVYTKREVELRDLQYDDIDHIDLLRYSKKVLLNWLKTSFGVDKQKIRDDVQRFRD